MPRIESGAEQQLLDPALAAERQGFCNPGNEASSAEWSGFSLDKMWTSGNGSFVTLGSERRRRECL